MDTRSKIITNDGARALGDVQIVSGYFDPITHEHAARLQALKDARPMLVLIATPENAILPSAARANLVAALRCVDYVTEIDGDSPIRPDVALESEDAVRLRALIERVARRQQAAQ
jgi:bifunctional ADP-heptose synthase (sugar kinase/adenylyltransferase)